MTPSGLAAHGTGRRARQAEFPRNARSGRPIVNAKLANASVNSAIVQPAESADFCDVVVDMGHVRRRLPNDIEQPCKIRVGVEGALANARDLVWRPPGVCRQHAVDVCGVGRPIQRADGEHNGASRLEVKSPKSLKSAPCAEVACQSRRASKPSVRGDSTASPASTNAHECGRAMSWQLATQFRAGQ